MAVDLKRQQRATALQVIAASWCSLRAWQPVDMRGVKVKVKFRRGWGSSGHATTSRAHGQVEVIVRLGEDEADGLAVLLHELAHVAAQRRGHDGHDKGWRAIFRAAALEVTGEEVVDQGGNCQLTGLVADAIRRKWQLKLSAGRVERSIENEVK